jgi:Spy/CpxP family protein refolding chaperone
MKTWRRLTTAVIAAWAGLASARAAESPRDLFEQMIPPELVLAQADAIGLDAKQREAVHRVQAELQPKMPPLLVRMRAERDALITLLAADTPDEALVLAQFEKLNAIETELKRVRLRMTVGVKKVLTPEQQTRALALQGQRLTDAPTGADTLPAKLQRVKEGLEQWKREGRDVTPLRERWDRFRAAEDKGHYRQARQALDEAIALLESPPVRQ